MSNLEAALAKYDYPLTPEMIAQKPASPRDTSKLLVYDRGTRKITVSASRHLAEFLPKGTILVFNNTKVIPARIRGLRKTGGAVEILCTGNSGMAFTGLCERRLSIGEEIRLPGGNTCTVTSVSGSEYTFSLRKAISLENLLLKFGTTPLPPYLKHSPLTESGRRKKYQAIFAKHNGSIAAPTASLHFTKRLLQSLKTRGIKKTEVTLHVGLGTFMPLTQAALDTGVLHRERFYVPANAKSKIISAKKSGDKVIPVGTTALRALESMDKKADVTDLFIQEGYQFGVADGLLTNFHVPRSSLMMLVSALVGRDELLRIYKTAIKNDFRFLSFGDAMLIL